MEVGVDASPASSLPATSKKKPKLWSVSPSQLDAYRRCPRVWFNQQILNDREPSKPFQAKGIAIHRALEIYLQTGEVLPTVAVPDPSNNGQISEIQTLEFVQVAIPHIPRPATDTAFWTEFPKDDKGAPTAMLLLEQPGEMVTWEGGPSVNQFIDVVEALPSTCRILDYKTTSNFRYAKTPAELEENTQLCWNAKYIFAISDYDEIEIEHLYLLTTGRPKAKPVITRVTRAQVEKIWNRDMATVREMIAWAELAPKDAEPLPPNIDSCDMYGGCYYRKKCGFDVATVGWKQRIEPMSEGQTNGLLAQLLQQAEKGIPQSKVVKETKSALKSGSSADLMAVLGASSAPAPAAAAPATPPKELFSQPAAASPLFPGAASAAEALREQMTGKAAVSITPPDAPPDTSTPEEVEAATASAAAKEDEDVVEEEPPALAKKRPGRPKKVVEAATPPAPVQETELQAKDPFPTKTVIPGLDPTKTNEGAVPSASPPAEVLKSVENLRNILKTPDPTFACGCEVLFIDTMPAKGWDREDLPVDLATMMHAFEDAAAKSAKEADYRLIDYKSKGYLALGVKVLMAGLPKSVFMDSRIPGADVFLSVVTPYVKMIFRGVR